MKAQELRAVRVRLGWSQAQLARVLQIGSVRTVRRWERGEVAIPGPVAVALELLEQAISRADSTEE